MSMTESEAIQKHIDECKNRIENIRGFVESNNDADAKECEKNVYILESAIAALEEVQQYRSIIGLTPDDLKQLEKDEIQTIGEVLKTFSEYYKYKDIGTVEELRELKEKATAKVSYGIKCPHCNFYTGNGKYCCNCGKMLIAGSEGKE